MALGYDEVPPPSWHGVVQTAFDAEILIRAHKVNNLSLVKPISSCPGSYITRYLGGSTFHNIELHKPSNCIISTTALDGYKVISYHPVDSGPIETPSQSPDFETIRLELGKEKRQNATPSPQTWSWPSQMSQTDISASETDYTARLQILLDTIQGAQGLLELKKGCN